MTVHLTQELEQMVQSRVNSGRYNSAGEVVRDALRLLADREELIDRRQQDVRKKITQGLDSLQRGEVSTEKNSSAGCRRPATSATPARCG